jgi:hypothetical protein
VKINFLPTFHGTSPRLRQRLQQNLEGKYRKNIITEYISMASSNNDSVANRSEDPDFDPTLQEVLETQHQSFVKENDDEMDVNLATNLVKHCSKKYEYKKKIGCYNQIILKHTRELITKIIEKFQSHYPREYNIYKAELNDYKIPINDDIYISYNADNNKYEIYEIQMYDTDTIQRLWTLLILMIHTIKKKENALANKYYRKIFYFLKYELAYLRYDMPYDPVKGKKLTYTETIKYVKINLCRNTLGSLGLDENDELYEYAKAVDLSHFSLKDNNDGAANDYSSIRTNENSIIQFLSSDCSAIVISSDSNYNTVSPPIQTDVLYGGKRRTRRRHKKPKHFSMEQVQKSKKTHFSKKCHKTLKRKGKKTLKRK